MPFLRAVTFNVTERAAAVHESFIRRLLRNPVMQKMTNFNGLPASNFYADTQHNLAHYVLEFCALRH